MPGAHRTARRIQAAALELFNRLGEPNVSTGQVAAALGISPGNLHYHHPSKEGLVNALYDQYEAALAELLPAAAGVRDIEDAWFFLHSLFECIWAYRFLYRDLNLLISRNRRLENGMPHILQRQTRAIEALLHGLSAHGALARPPAATLPTQIVLVLSYWLSYEYARNPRHALEPAGLQAAVLRGAAQALGLLLPYLAAQPQAHLQALLRAYETPEPDSNRSTDE
ncbi:MAG: TetR/AcrR family transcriptional regulator [Hylemonella sp.]